MCVFKANRRDCGLDGVWREFGSAETRTRGRMCVRELVSQGAECLRCGVAQHLQYTATRVGHLGCPPRKQIYRYQDQKRYARFIGVRPPKMKVVALLMPHGFHLLGSPSSDAVLPYS